MNDFAAQAYCLLALKPGDVKPLQAFDGDWPPGNRVIYGPGTGLGVAQLILEGGSPRVVAGEGGNVAFGPSTETWRGCATESSARLKDAGQKTPIRR